MGAVCRLAPDHAGVQADGQKTHGAGLCRSRYRWVFHCEQWAAAFRQAKCRSAPIPAHVARGSGPRLGR